MLDGRAPGEIEYGSQPEPRSRWESRLRHADPLIVEIGGHLLAEFPAKLGWKNPKNDREHTLRQRPSLHLSLQTDRQ